RYAKMKATLKLMDRREPQDPGTEFWNGYYTRLQERIHQVESRRRFPQPWMLQVAAGIILVLMGVLIGKNYFQKEPAVVKRTVPPVEIPVQTADDRVQHFLDRSQVLLLGLVNLSPDGDASSLVRRKKLSQDLLHQAGTLKTELKEAEHRRLLQLVSELEVILLQIANLEERNDFQEIEMVKGGVDRKGILLKINLEKMRITGREIERNAQPKSRL
ncbi:MAG TPA: hypothetical protein VI958_04045, partial [Acidobacteriota bacterium]